MRQGMLSLSENALLTTSWWIILIPGAFLITMLMCLTNIGSYLKRMILWLLRKFEELKDI